MFKVYGAKTDLSSTLSQLRVNNTLQQPEVEDGDPLLLKP